MTQGDLFRDEGIKRVTTNNVWWVERVVNNFVECLAERKQFFTTDDVWADMEDFDKWISSQPDFNPDKDLVTANDNRAMGGVMRMAQAQGLIEPTDRVVKSTRPVCHSRPIRVWRSKLI